MCTICHFNNYFVLDHFYSKDEVYFNEAYTNGDSSSDSEQINGTSNKSDSKSLMSAIVSAIKSAPTNWHKGKTDKNLTGKYCL